MSSHRCLARLMGGSVFSGVLILSLLLGELGSSSRMGSMLVMLVRLEEWRVLCLLRECS